MYSYTTVTAWLLGPLHKWVAPNPALAHALAVVAALFLLSFAHVVVGKMVPRSLALQHAEAIALRVIGILQWIQRLCFPLMLLLNTIGNWLLVHLGIPQGYTRRRLYSPEELEQVVAESYKGGLLSDDERQMIQSIFDLGERRVGQVMTPRPRIVAIPLDISEEDLRTTIVTTPYSRLPVYQDDIDHIVGLLLNRDFVRQQLDPETTFNLKALMRRMPAVPEAMTADRLLAAFKRSQIHMALVFDEYGGTAGVVTLDDLVEEVVGEVHDEFDQVEEPLLRELEPGIFLARGDLMLDDLYEIAPGAIPYDDDDILPDVDTVGGLVVSLLGRPANPGDQVEMQQTIFTVERVSGFAVNTVRIVLKPADTPHEEDEETPGDLKNGTS
jgi:CBS domain containing-hemolysin-like protein